MTAKGAQLRQDRRYVPKPCGFLSEGGTAAYIARTLQASARPPTSKNQNLGALRGLTCQPLIDERLAGHGRQSWHDKVQHGGVADHRFKGLSRLALDSLFALIPAALRDD